MSSVTVPIVKSEVVAWTRGAPVLVDSALRSRTRPEIAFALFAAVRVAAVVGLPTRSSTTATTTCTSLSRPRRP